MRAYSPTITYSQAQGCITSTASNDGNLDVAAAFNACGLGQIVSEGTAAYKQANSSPVKPSGPPAATLTPPPRPPRPKITKVTFRHHRLTITVADIPKGLDLQLVVQARNPRGQMITLGHITTTRTKASIRVPRWDRIVARFLAGKTQLPVVIANRVARRKHAPAHGHSVR